MLRLLLAAILLPLLAAAGPYGSLTRQYLELTEEQDARLRDVAAPYYEWHRTQDQRIRQVEAEIREEALRTPPDPMALGVRFAELESIRRQSVERLAEVIRLRRTILTPEQLRRVQLLEQADRLGATVQDANCEWVMLPENLDRACGVASVNLRTPLTPPNAVIPGILDPTAPFDPTAPLRRYLELTPAQSATYLRNLELFRSREADAGRQLACAEQGASRALQASPLSPASIGARKAEAITAHRLILSLYEETVNVNVGLLTPAQKQRLALLEQAQVLAEPAALARRYALLPSAQVPFTGLFAFSGIPDGVGPYFCPSL